MQELYQKIRDIPDFPQKGIIFKDITPLLQDARTFSKAIDLLSYKYFNKEIDLIACVEARGFIIGGALAYRLGKGLILLRKPGKLPYKTYKAEYELEYGTNSLEIHQDAVKVGQKILVVDDLLATGGTAKAMCELIEKAGGEVVEIAFLIELEFLKGREKLKNYKVFSLLKL